MFIIINVICIDCSGCIWTTPLLTWSTTMKTTTTRQITLDI
jgi:hypothetical protein